jgi:hypothetical protein
MTQHVRPAAGCPQHAASSYMTRSTETQALIDKAMEIIGPSADQDVVARAVVQTRGYVKRSSKSLIKSGRYGAVTKEHKKAARRVAAALHRLQSALRDTDLVRCDDLQDDDLERWRQSYETAALKPGVSKAYRAFDQAKHVAAEGAAALLQKHNVPLLIGRASQFVRLAALLYEGRERADLRTVCRQVRDGVN